ncbi:MAG: HD domain-containing phosphohydrolase, partial [Vibrio sp.]
MTVFSAVLIIVSFQYTHSLLQGSAKALSAENSKKIESELHKNMAPIFSTLDFLAYSSVIHGEVLGSSKWRWLAAVHQSFTRNSALVALYYGSNNGDFTVIRPLFTEQAKQQFNSPASAVLYLEKSTVEGMTETYYFNDKIQQIDFRKGSDNTFDPRTRPWYQVSENKQRISITEPYAFYFLKTYGITLSRSSADNQHVVGADFTLVSLSSELASLAKYPDSKMIIFDSHLLPIAQHNTDLQLDDQQSDNTALLQHSIFRDIVNRISPRTIYEDREYDGETWSLSLTPIAISPDIKLHLAEAVRHRDVLDKLLAVRDTQVALSIGLVGVCFLIVLFVSRRIAQPMKRLVELTGNIAHFDFKKAPYPTTMITELSNLTHSIHSMEHTLSELIKSLRDTAANTDLEALAKTVARQSYAITKAETIILYSYQAEQAHFSIAANHAIIPFKLDLDVLLSSTPWILSDLRQGNTVHLKREDNLLRRFQQQLFNADIYFFPLLNREGQLIGVLNVGYERNVEEHQLEKHAFLRELLSFAQIAKDNIDSMQQQKEMLDAVVERLAFAIDAKSPYTHEHTQRVSFLTKALTQLAEDDHTYYPQFIMSKDRWSELKLATWLHDCGKITTPQHVTDKATKLETIYDRIHEIRTRVEVLKSQAETDYWRQLNQGGSKAQLDKQLTQTLNELDEDFTFIAHCNQAKEALSDRAIERLNNIAQRRWKRTIDDRMGVAWSEQQRAGNESQSLPIMEPLLSDKDAHLVPWLNSHVHFTEKHAFNIKPGDVQYNRGELYNLSVRSGTLTPEEHFLINDHIIQTIMMLDNLPYPAHLRQVYDIAGQHHEQMNGMG